MSKGQRNTPQSVHQRLLNEARKTGKPFQELLQHYAIERFLYRIGTSPHADRVLLKGALLLRVWGLPAARPTMDIDLLGKGGHSGEYWERFAKECMSVKSVDDGMRYEPDGITVEQITPDVDYRGWRIRFRAYLGRAWVVMQLDIGLGDAVAPSPIMIDYPTLIDMPHPVLKAYRPETAIAEKYQAMIELDMANSRMKDFFDIRELIRVLTFRGEDILAAMRKTFERRKTKVNEIPP